jgi:predicted transcriptional regulator
MFVGNSDTSQHEIGMRHFYENLEHLEYAGAISESMWANIVANCEAMIDAHELQIEALANIMAAAHAGNWGVDDNDVAQASWCIAHLMETVRAMKSVIDHDQCKKRQPEMYAKLAAGYCAKQTAQAANTQSKSNVHPLH